MDIMQMTKHSMLRGLFFTVGFFAFLFLSSCEREPLSTPQSEPEQHRFEEPHSATTALRLQRMDELTIDEAFRKELGTRMADYRLKLEAIGKKDRSGKSGSEIIVPDPAAGIYTIQDGVDAASEGHEVKVQSGEYFEEVIIATPGIEVKADGAVTLYGAFTILANEVEIKGFDVIYGGYVAIFGTDVSGLEISGNTVTGGANVGIILSSASDCTIRNNEVSGVRFGIALVDFSGVAPCTDNTIKSNRLIGNDVAGIQLQNNSTGNTIKENVCQGSRSGGIALFQSNNNTIKDNTCNNNVNPPNGFGDGIVLTLGSTGNVIRGNECNSNGFSGINIIRGSNANQVSGNVCKYNAWFGIDLFDVTENMVGPNNTSTRNRYAGIQVETSSGNTIANNIADDNEFSGVAVVYHSDGNEVYGNSCSRNGAMGIDLFIARENHIGPDNEANENRQGIRLADNTSDNVVSGNSAFNNVLCDIVNEDGTGNTETNNEADCIDGF